jgi:Icc-related predicted phosphoesterase
MKVLSLSDVVVSRIYSPQVRALFGDVDLILGCGDLPYYYLEFITSMLDKPTFFVRGNHAEVVEYTETGPLTHPRGTFDLHNQVINHQGLLLAGVEGSIRYRRGPFQYSQSEMWLNVFKLVPALILNRMTQGRYLDIFVTHASPWKIHDQPDLPHHGVKAFRWLLKVFQPAYHFHGHIHLYRPESETHTRFHNTEVINTFGHLVSDLELTLPMKFSNKKDFNTVK